MKTTQGVLFAPGSVPDYAGAKGTCDNCGLRITLEARDGRKIVPSLISGSPWRVRCPRCRYIVWCER